MGSPEDQGEAPEHPQHLARVEGILIDKTEVTWGQYRRFLDESGRPSPKTTRVGNDWAPWRCNTRDGGPHEPTAAGAYPDCVSPYGVLDLAGSVAEWCSDWYDEAFYANSPADNPKGPESGTRRVSRGGGWMSPSFSGRSAYRQGTDPTWPNPMRGFRCAQDDDNRDPVGSTQEPVGGQQPVRRIEVRIETLVNRPDAPPDTCQVVQSLTGGPAALWSSLGEAERSGNSGFAASSAALQCATGVAPTVSGDGSIPLYRHDLSVTVGWDPGAMDPGPGEGGRLSLTVRSHRLRGFSTEGNPLYDDLGTAQRTFRLEEGEEFFVPLLTDGAEGSMALGVDEVMLRIQAGWAGRPGGHGVRFPGRPGSCSGVGDTSGWRGCRTRRGGGHLFDYRCPDWPKGAPYPWNIRPGCPAYRVDCEREKPLSCHLSQWIHGPSPAFPHA